jgi:hypothetical protein
VARLAAALRAVDAWLFRPGDPRRLAALRIGLGGVLTARLVTGPYLDLAHQPAALFRPISFMKLLPAMPPPAVVLPIQVLAVAAAALATVGLRTRLTLPLAWLLALPLVAMTSSLGKTVHNDVLLLLCLLPLLPSPAGEAWSLDASRRRGTPSRDARGTVLGGAPGTPSGGARLLVALRLAGVDRHGGGRRRLLLHRPGEAAARRAGLGDQREPALGTVCLQ